MNISETSWSIEIKFYLKHHWGGGKAAIGFWPDRVRTLVSMATDSSHRFIMGKILLAPPFLIGSSSYLQVTRTTIISRASSNFGQIRPSTAELGALEHPKKFPYTYDGRNVVSTLSPSFFIGSSSFLQVTRTIIKAWMSWNFSSIRPRTAE